MNFESGATAYVAADILRRRILNGELKPGDRLVQRPLAAELGISRIPLREALIRLEREGWITNEPNKGAVVSQIDATSIAEHYEMIGVLHGHAGARAAEQADPDAVAELRDIVRAVDEETRGSELTELIREFDEQVIVMANSTSLNRLLNSASAPTPTFLLDEVPGRAAVEKERLHRILDAIEAGDAARARHEYEAFTKNLCELVELHLERVGGVSFAGSDSLHASSGGVGGRQTTVPRPVSWDYAYDPELVEFAHNAALDIPNDVTLAREHSNFYLGSLGPGDTTGLDVSDHMIPGLASEPEVRVRLYVPHTRASTPTPAILHLHGGGFYVGDLETEHGGMTALARELGVVVLSVDYRLAPEHPYPAALNDCYAGLLWLHGEALTLGIDLERIAVGGGSAGGGLAAAVALYARDHDGPSLCFQFLSSPELDDRLDTMSMRTFVDTPLWSRPAAKLSWEWYLNGQTEDVPAYAAPARADDLSGLPPAYVSTMEFDPMRDEGIIYGLRMLEAGVGVELHQYRGTFHGSAMVEGATVSKRDAEERFAVWRHALGLTRRSSDPS